MSVSGIIKSKLGFYGNFGLGIVMITICLGYTTFLLKVRRFGFRVMSRPQSGGRQEKGGGGGGEQG